MKPRHFPQVAGFYFARWRGLGDGWSVCCVLWFVRFGVLPRLAGLRLDNKMARYSVSVPVVSYYEIELEEPNMLGLIEDGGLYRYLNELGLAITEKGSYQGWDLDLGNVSVAPIE